MLDFLWLQGWTAQDVIAFFGSCAIVYGLCNLSFGNRKSNAHMKKRGQIESEDPEQN